MCALGGATVSLISRDSFARQELHRETVLPHGATCKWCGNTNGKGSLYQYSVESDSGRRSDIPYLFCSVGCMRDYHQN